MDEVSLVSYALELSIAKLTAKASRDIVCGKSVLTNIICFYLKLMNAENKLHLKVDQGNLGRKIFVSLFIRIFVDVIRI